MKEKILKIREIRINEKLYPREGLNQTVVRNYAKAMSEGDVFPKPHVALFKGKHLLVDGRHRIEAMELNGEEYIKCDIQNNYPGLNEIYLAAVRANLKHGIRLSDADKQKIAVTMQDMKFEIDDIQKLLHISIAGLEKRNIGKMQRQVIFKEKEEDSGLKGRGSKKRKNLFSPIIRETKEAEEELKLIDDSDEQIGELSSFYDYIMTAKFKLDNKAIVRLINKINRRCYTLLKRTK